MTQAIIAPVDTRRTPRSERAERNEQAAGRATEADPVVIPTPVFVGGRWRAATVRLSVALVGAGMAAWIGLAGSALLGDQSVPELRISADDAIDTTPIAPATSPTLVAAPATEAPGTTEGAIRFLPFRDLFTSPETRVLGATQTAEPAELVFGVAPTDPADAAD